MSVFQFFQKHIDAIQYSHDNVDSAKVYNFVRLLLNSRGKIPIPTRLDM